MSESNYENLKDEVRTSLHTKGVIGKFKAQVRASVYSLIKENSGHNKVYMENEKLLKIKENKNAILMMNLVRELFEFYELDFTSSVFEPEANMEDETFPSKHEMRDLLELSGSNEKPLLLELIDNYRKNLEDTSWNYLDDSNYKLNEDNFGDQQFSVENSETYQYYASSFEPDNDYYQKENFEDKVSSKSSSSTSPSSPSSQSRLETNNENKSESDSPQDMLDFSSRRKKVELEPIGNNASNSKAPSDNIFSNFGSLEKKDPLNMSEEKKEPEKLEDSEKENQQKEEKSELTDLSSLPPFKKENDKDIWGSTPNFDYGNDWESISDYENESFENNSMDFDEHEYSDTTAQEELGAFDAVQEADYLSSDIENDRF
eukprot:gb/GECH01012544.1/.p1 GENE.gb/GECH01012544.1/~~gb/GECH01012544.1/.p1  ORF type:complete len:374 (+),score=105.42 gb/GECH01012544.1/:1-1122(+)